SAPLPRALLPPLFSPRPLSSDMYTLSLHDALPIFSRAATVGAPCRAAFRLDDARGCNLYRQQSALSRVNESLSTAAVARLSLTRSEEHTSELQSRVDLVCRLLLEKKNNQSIVEIRY